MASYAVEHFLVVGAPTTTKLIAREMWTDGQPDSLDDAAARRLRDSTASPRRVRPLQREAIEFDQTPAGVSEENIKL